MNTTEWAPSRTVLVRILFTTLPARTKVALAFASSEIRNERRTLRFPRFAFTFVTRGSTVSSPTCTTPLIWSGWIRQTYL